MKKTIPWLIGLVIALLVAGGIWRGMRTLQAKADALRAAEQAKAEAVYLLTPSDVVTANLQKLALTLPISGTVQAVHTATIKARVAGEIGQLTLREGDSVRAGQTIAAIDTTESQARLAQATQQADAARAQRDIQQRQFDNNRALAAQGFISATALAASHSQLQAAQSSYEAALSAAAVLQKTLADTELRSPIDGQVAKKWVHNGEKVGPDAPVLDVVDLRQLELQAQLPPADALQVQVGQLANLQLNGSNQRIRAQVTRISPIADSTSRNIAVYLQIALTQPAINATDLKAENPLQLRQGLYLQGLLNVGSTDALSIPLSAVRTDKPEAYVQLLVPQGTALAVVHRPVVLAERALLDGQTWVAVTQGLQAQDMLLAGGVGQLRAGTLVRIDRPQGSENSAAPTAAQQP